MYAINVVPNTTAALFRLEQRQVMILPYVLKNSRNMPIKVSGNYYSTYFDENTYYYFVYLCVWCVIMPLYTNFLRRKYELMANKKCVALAKEQLENIIKERDSNVKA